MNTNKIGMLVVLSLSLATVTMGTAGLSLVSPVFAGGDHHDHGHDRRNARTMVTTTVMTHIKLRK